MRHCRTLVWYHPELDMLVLRWKCGPAITVWEGIEATDAEGSRWLTNAMHNPSKYGWVKIGGFH